MKIYFDTQKQALVDENEEPITNLHIIEFDIHYEKGNPTRISLSANVPNDFFKPPVSLRQSIL